MTLNIVLKLQPVQIGHRLKSCKVGFSRANSANILTVLKIKLWVVELFITLEFGQVFLLWIIEVKLDCEWVVGNLFTVAFIQVPFSFRLIAIKNVLAGLIENLAIVVLNFACLHLAPFLFSFLVSLMILPSPRLTLTLFLITV